MTERFRVVDAKLVYKNPWMKVYEQQVVRDGEPGVYGTVERDDSVIVIPWMPERRTVLLRQYRFPTREYSWELPMGGVSPGESPIEAARRELAEETGLVADEFEIIGQYRAVPGLTAQQVTVVMTPVDDSKIEQQTSLRAVDDVTERRIRDLSELNRMVQAGRITDGFTIAGILYLNLHLAVQAPNGMC